MKVILDNLLCHDGKYGDLMYNCVFTSTNAYTMRLIITIMLSWWYDGCYSLQVSKNRPSVSTTLTSRPKGIIPFRCPTTACQQVLAQPAGLRGVQIRLVGPCSHDTCVEKYYTSNLTWIGKTPKRMKWCFKW